MSDQQLSARPISETDSTQQPAVPFSTGYANYVLGVLFIVYVFNFIDRQVLSVFIGPIKAEFGASDTSMGMLVGFAFALLYTVAGIPIARWADRGNRRSIIAIGLAIWSAMTMATGMAKSFTHLLLARVGVGIGEAAGTPPAHSLIADYFPPRRRATALAVYSAGVFVGAGCAYLGGGYLREFFDWRTAFLMVGAPGLLFALVVRFTVHEPVRGCSEGRSAVGDGQAPSLAETLRFLLSSRTWIYLVIGSSFLSITGYGVLMWGYEFYGRVHGMAPIAIGKWMALIVGVGGSIGTVLGGRLADALVAIKPARSLWVPALVTTAGFPLGVAFLLADSQLTSLLCFLPCYLLLNVYIPTMYSTNQSLVQLPMRATASAILLFIINIVGAGAGPLLVGALSDAYASAAGSQSIRFALLTASVATVFGGVFLMLASRTLEADLQRVNAAS